MEPQPPRVAVVGGGITGAVAAAALAKAGLAVTVFDQGRRGPGGRASHRRVCDGCVVPDDDLPPGAGVALEFDHGCQFFRADDPRMRALAAGWCAAGWAAEWRGRFGRISGAAPFAPVCDADAAGGAEDFFGLPGSAAPVYVGVGGMQRLPRLVLGASGATVRRGVRVKALRPLAGSLSRWELLATSGEGAFHDTPEAAAAAAAEESLGAFDAVVLTDISSSFEGWHRASAGLPPDFAARVSGRARLPLFACMVAYAAPLGLPLDGITLHHRKGDGDGGGDGDGDGDGVLWFAARSGSKPGFPEPGGEGECECWTLVSTPGYACAEIGRTPMQDASGAFLPQSNDYLSAVPAPALAAAFAAAVAPMLAAAGRAMPAAVYSQAQRWGSAVPAPHSWEGRPMESMGVSYNAAIPPLLPTRSPGAAASDFVAADEQRLFYAGDFCSGRAPGFEAAALSGADAAAHVADLLCPTIGKPAE